MIKKYNNGDEFKKDIYSKNLKDISKNSFVSRQGFTLVELLLVMAIIGILAGTIAVGMGAQRKRAKVTAALKVANNIMAETAYCYLGGKLITSPCNGNTSTVTVCSGASIYPDLPKGCNYGGFNQSTYTLSIKCNGGNDGISCDVRNNKCREI